MLKNLIPLLQIISLKQTKKIYTTTNILNFKNSNNFAIAL